MLKIRRVEKREDVYDITVEDNHNFYANGVLVHNCVEVLQPTTPIVSIDDTNGEIGICMLAAVNTLEMHTENDIENTCAIAVRSLESVIDYQDYPVVAGENFTKTRRSLGVGITNLAGYLAKHKLSYNDAAALPVIHELMEKIQWHLLNQSCKLAEQLGPCDKFGDTKYSKGMLPLDWYKKTVDELVKPKYTMDWEGLRKRIKKFGLRHSTVSAIMPCESCLEWDSVLLAKDGKYNFHELADKLGLDHKKIESENLIGWHVSKKTVTILTKDGSVEANKLYYNGFSDVTEIELENGQKLFPTINHRFLVKVGDVEEWKRVYELSVDDDIVKIEF